MDRGGDRCPIQSAQVAQVAKRRKSSHLVSVDSMGEEEVFNLFCNLLIQLYLHKTWSRKLTCNGDKQVPHS
jgi:hypothetical protein